MTSLLLTLVSNTVNEVEPDGTVKPIGSNFNTPFGVAVDADGDVFVGESSNSFVTEFKPDGTSLPVGSGFSSPEGVAVNAAGDVFVADSGNHTVKEVLPNGSIHSIGRRFRPASRRGSGR